MTDHLDPNDPLAGIEPYQEYGDASSREQTPTTSAAPGDSGGMPPRSPLLTGLVLGLMLVVVSIAVFQLFSGDDENTPGVASDTTLAPTGDETDSTAEGTDTTVATGTEGDTTGTDVTDPGTGTGTPVGDGTVIPYDPVGDPLTISEMTMAADGIGPITLGLPADQAVGRLVASFGAPEEDTGPQVSVGDWGVCEGDTERIVRWGPLAAIVVVDDDGTETFAGYRLDLAFGGLSHPAVDLATLSGLQAGNAFRQLSEQIYPDFDVRQIDATGLSNATSAWELRSSETGNLLLWGPLADDDVVRGIYSNNACGTF